MHGALTLVFVGGWGESASQHPSMKSVRFVLSCVCVVSVMSSREENLRRRGCIFYLCARRVVPSILWNYVIFGLLTKPVFQERFPRKTSRSVSQDRFPREVSKRVPIRDFYDFQEKHPNEIRKSDLQRERERERESSGRVCQGRFARDIPKRDFQGEIARTFPPKHFPNIFPRKVSKIVFQESPPRNISKRYLQEGFPREVSK